jgi:hypothetical protein
LANLPDFLEKITLMPSSYRVSYYTFFNVNPEEPPKGRELSKEEKERNSWLSSRRVVVEHMIRLLLESIRMSPFLPLVQNRA